MVSQLAVNPSQEPVRVTSTYIDNMVLEALGIVRERSVGSAQDVSCARANMVAPDPGIQISHERELELQGEHDSPRSGYGTSVNDDLANVDSSPKISRSSSQQVGAILTPKVLRGGGLGI